MKRFLLLCVMGAMLGVVALLKGLVDGHVYQWAAGGALAVAVVQLIAPRVKVAGVWSSVILALVCTGLAMFLAGNTRWDDGHDLFAAFAIAFLVMFLAALVGQSPAPVHQRPAHGS